jgi:protein-S-isoprenylcysteine O-methyltransferase Ste14
MALALFGAFLFLGSISPFIIWILFIILIDRTVIPLEEKNLEERFGNEYLEYRSKVRRWL